MVLGSAEVDQSLSLSHRTSRESRLYFPSGCEVGVNLAFFCLSGIHLLYKVLCDTAPVCTPYASLRGSEPIVGMDGSRWIWVIGSAFSPYSRYLLAIWTFLWFVLRVLLI